MLLRCSVRAAVLSAAAEAEQQEGPAGAAAAGAQAALSSLVSPVFSMQGVRWFSCSQRTLCS